MKKRWIMIAAIIGIALIGLVAVGPIMSDVETPNYVVVTAESNIEVRRYDPMIVAEIQMSGWREDTIGDGFRLLADYIFGNNIAQKDIAMTAPVQQQKKGNTWQVSFVMPSEYKMDTLPKPGNDRVTLKQISAKTFAVITFSGTTSNENIKEHEKQLIEHVRANNILVMGTPKYAFYNPPWTLPSMRRNEIMIEIQGK